VALAGSVGLAYYLSIWPQFRRVLAQTSGWESAPAVLGNLTLALLAHLGPMLVLFGLAGFALLARRFGKKRFFARGAEVCGDKRLGVVESLGLFAASLLPAVLVLLVLRPVPYPRVFLVFVPIWSFAVVAAVRDLACLSRVPGRVLVVAVLLNGVLWERGSAWLTQRQLARNEYAQNLLQQYYREGRDLSTIAARLTETPASETVVLTNFYDFVAMRYYLLLRDFPPERVLGVGQQASARFKNDYDALKWRWLIVATSPEKAAEMARPIPEKGKLTLLLSTPNRFVYGLERC
jgi:hypothetical protein